MVETAVATHGAGAVVEAVAEMGRALSGGRSDSAYGGSHRDVVDQTYQVALNLQFENKQQQDDYQVHPMHLDFVEKAFKPNCARVVVYDFE